MAEQVFRGKTEDAAAPFLSADFWEKDRKIVAVVDRSFKAGDKQCYALRLVKPITLDGDEVENVSIGNMAGLRMALQAAHVHELRADDKLVLTCTGKTPPKKQGNSPMVNFEVEITRDTNDNSEPDDSWR